MDTSIFQGSLTKAELLKKALGQWEKRRVPFNIVVGVSGAAGLLFTIKYWDFFTLAGVAFWAIFASISFTLGFGIQALAVHYTCVLERFPRFGYYLWVIGTLFSALATFYIAFFCSAAFPAQP